MANPQKENGYTPIANELLEAIYKNKFNATQLNIILVICRYTYGFSRKEHDLSIGFIAQASNCSYRHIKRELSQLIDNKIINVRAVNTFTTSRKITLNKNYEEWEQVPNTTPVPRLDTTTGDRLVPTTGDGLVPATGDGLVPTTGDGLVPQDKQYIKQEENNIYSDLQSPPISSKPTKKDVDTFFEAIWQLYPKKRGKGDISEAKKKALYKIGFEELERCIDRYKQEIANNNTDPKYIKGGGSFFTKGYIDYLDKEYTELENPKQPSIQVDSS